MNCEIGARTEQPESMRRHRGKPHRSCEILAYKESAKNNGQERETCQKRALDTNVQSRGGCCELLAMLRIDETSHEAGPGWDGSALSDGHMADGALVPLYDHRGKPGTRKPAHDLFDELEHQQEGHLA